jgi:hypothetical protein
VSQANANDAGGSSSFTCTPRGANWHAGWLRGYGGRRGQRCPSMRLRGGGLDPRNQRVWGGGISPVSPVPVVFGVLSSALGSASRGRDSLAAWWSGLLCRGSMSGTPVTLLSTRKRQGYLVWMTF